MPRALHAGLAPGVSDLDCRHRTVVFNERNGALQRMGVFRGPNAQVSVRDPALRGYGSRFGEHDSGTTHRELGKVGEMPVIGQPVHGGILAHRRDRQTIADLKLAELEGAEEQGLSWV